MRFVVTLAVLALVQQNSCDSSTPKPAPKPAAVPKAPLHRFILTRFPNDSGVAFDTQTGQICKTWEWAPGGKTADPDPVTGTTPQRVIGEFAPTCLSLYVKYPSGPGDSVATTEDQQ